MRLKTLMEEKYLDFNQPLLTVRRLPSNPEIQQRKKSAPKLPPLPFYRSELKSGPVSNPGTVPFIWEKAPGRPKNQAIIAFPNHAPNPPPGRSQIPKQPDSDSEVVFCQESSSCSENDDESYLDALDTFSRSESFFIDSPVSSRGGSSDQQGRDFMMGRFLPAAKAVASEALPARKPQEQPRPIPLAVNGEQKAVDNRVEVNGDKIEEEEDDYVYDDSPAKLCGLLPRFCVLNMVSVPGLKMQTGRAHSVRMQTGQSLYNGSRNDLGSKSRGRDGRRLEGSNLYKRLNGNAGFPTQTGVPSSSSVSQTEPAKGKDSKNFLELLASEGSEWGSGSNSPLLEKTLDADSAKDSNSEPNSDESDLETRRYMSRIPLPEEDISEESAIVDLSFMIPPPLPKTPSDSWLTRALDSKKPTPRGFVGMNVLDRDADCKTVEGSKWEAIVKSSKVHHGHSRFSEELRLPPIAESGKV